MPKNPEDLDFDSRLIKKLNLKNEAKKSGHPLMRQVVGGYKTNCR